MAALEDSLAKFQGKKWSILANKIGIHNLLANQSTEENVKRKSRTGTSFLKKEDMEMYGYCPVYENFYLVVCDLCGSSVKPQALRHHLETWHADTQISASKTLSTNTTTTTSCNTRSIFNSDMTSSTCSTYSLNVTESSADSLPLPSSSGGDRWSKESGSSRKSLHQSSPGLANPIHPSHIPPSVVTPHTPTQVSRSLSSGATASSVSQQTSNESFSSINTSSANQFSNIFTNTSKVSGVESLCSSPPLLSDSSMKVSLASLLSSNSTVSNNRSNSFCNSSNNTNALEAVLNNNFDFDECAQNPPSISPLLDFSGPSTLSKEDEDSLDRRLREFENGTGSSSNDLLEQQQSNHQSTSLVNELPSDNSLLAPSPQSLGGALPNIPLDPMGGLGQNIGMQNVSLSHSSDSNNVGSILPSISSSSGMLMSSDSLMNNTANSHILRNSLSRPCDNGEAEAVSRISAMLQQEAEAITASNLRDSRSSTSSSQGSASSIPPRDVIEAQGHAARSGLTSNHHRNSSGLSEAPINSGGLSSVNGEVKTHSNTSNISMNHMGAQRQVSRSNSRGNGPSHGSGMTANAPVPIQMSVETLNQIQADLLATVSESDLNAVLNATPDSSDPSVLPTNNSELFFPNNTTVQFGESTFLNSSSNFNPSQQVNSSNQQQNFGLESISDALTSSSSTSQTPTLDSLLLRDRLTSNNSSAEKISQAEELKNAVNSITNLNNTFDSQISGYLPNLNQSHIVQSPVPSPSPSLSVNLPVASPMSSSSVSSIQMGSLQNASNVHELATLGQSAVTSQGITVVIGGTGTPITLPQSSPATNLTQTNKSNSGNTLVQRIVHQGSVTTSISLPQQSPVSNSITTPTASAGNTLTTTASPKKSNKKKKPGEHRKIVPLKDREYNPEIHCGVVVSDTGKPCTRSLTCKTHSLSLRRAVNSRSKKFDDLLSEHKANKEASNKAAKALEASTVIQSSVGSSRVVTQSTTSLPTTSPLLSKSLGGRATPSPQSSSFVWGSVTSHPHHVPPSLQHADNFHVSTPPAPAATCVFNSRKVGGFLATEHRTDLLRSVFRHALKKPSPTYLLDNSNTLSAAVSVQTADRLHNVKPLLARKLQSTTPMPVTSMMSKDGITVGTGYNGHIQVATNNLGIVGNVQNHQQLKRTFQNIDNKMNTINICGKNKNKKPKMENGPAINILSNVVQLDSSGNAKNHSIPLVAVSIPNGLSTSQTINLSNINLSNLRTSSNQPVRIHPSTVKTLMRQDQIIDNRNALNANKNVVSMASSMSANQTLTDGANLVFSSPAGVLIADGGGGLRTFKTDSSGSIRLELHGNTFGDSRFIHASSLSKVVSSNANVITTKNTNNNNITNVVQTLSATNSLQQPTNQQQAQLSNQQQQLQQGNQQQVAYLTATPANCVNSNNQPLTLQVQQVLNRLQSKGGGLKFLTPQSNQSTASPSTGAPHHHRTAYLLQQDNQPS